jgi:hypothetical protein
VETSAELGRRLVREMRDDQARDSDDAALHVLRWGADELSDEQVWEAAMAALDEATTDSELWLLGDGFLSESLRTRPALDARWRDLRGVDPKVTDVYRVMEDPTMNFEVGPWD